MAELRGGGGILDYMGPSIVSDERGIASNSPSFSMQEEGFTPEDEEVSRRFDSSSFGSEDQEKKGSWWKDALKLLAGAAGAYGVGKLAGDFDTTEALAAYGKGVLGAKHEEMKQRMDQDLEEDKMFLDQARKDMEELARADIGSATRAGLPSTVVQKHQELQRKYQEALLNDGRISRKEAMELIALSAPIKAALSEAKGTMESPEFKGREKEKGDYAEMLGLAERLTKDGPYTETEALPAGQAGPPEPTAEYSDAPTLARELHRRKTMAEVPDEQGYLPRDRAMLERATLSQQGMDSRQAQRHQNAMELLRERARLRPPRNAREKSVFDLARTLLSTTSKFADSPEQALSEAVTLAEQEIGAGRTAPPSATPQGVEELIRDPATKKLRPRRPGE